VLGGDEMHLKYESCDDPEKELVDEPCELPDDTFVPWLL